MSSIYKDTYRKGIMHLHALSHDRASCYTSTTGAFGEMHDPTQSLLLKRYVVKGRV